MTSDQLKGLCLALMRADDETEVERILRDAGYWDDDTVWRPYGDDDSNFSTTGNQQTHPEAALVEKIVNSLDAVLTRECLVAGIDPTSSTAPQTVSEAVARFFGAPQRRGNTRAGQISTWPESLRKEVARRTTLSATGAKPGAGRICLTIADNGEGQTPDDLPSTLLSLHCDNKQYIHFVQGKFNMGGTGALKFCGRHNLQLVISRRDPELIASQRQGSSDEFWGFTVVRRESPSGGRRSSVYTYLAPVGAADRPHRGDVLRFSAPSLPMYPEAGSAYARASEWGTVIKLYEYDLPSGARSHILRKDGLLSRLDLLLPGLALPIRLHECRDYSGHEGSFDTTLTGLCVRLEDDHGGNLEQGFPTSASMTVAGQEMTVTAYAFKKGKAETYRRREGLIFVVNGQTHGHFPQDFFRRKEVGLSYLADSLLLIIDCSRFDPRQLEDLFMNSRDRLSEGELKTAIEKALADMLSEHAGLRELRERRRREETASKLDDSKPLEEVLGRVLKHSPALSALFGLGPRLSQPFRTQDVAANEKVFEGRTYPTYFKFSGKEYGHELTRECHQNLRCRVTFETDAANDYLDRAMDPGQFRLLMIARGESWPVDTCALNLWNGIATLSISLPFDAQEGHVLHFAAEVSDSNHFEPFVNHLTVTVKAPAKPKPGGGGRRRPPGTTPGQDREREAGITLPEVREVYRNEWSSKEPPFDDHTALRVRYAGDDVGDNGKGEAQGYDFYVNMDNVFLLSELKSSRLEPDLLKARFKFALVLCGLAILHYNGHAAQETADDTPAENSGEVPNVEDKVEAFTAAVAPVLLPMIDALGDLEIEGDESQ
jgi:hypothetical protein